MYHQDNLYKIHSLEKSLIYFVNEQVKLGNESLCFSKKTAKQSELTKLMSDSLLLQNDAKLVISNFS